MTRTKEQPAYTIDQASGTVTVLDEHTGRSQTATISELLELLLWLKSREPELRKMVYDREPLPYQQPVLRLREDGRYYIGCTSERMLVRVERGVYEQFLQEQERSIREQWLETALSHRKIQIPIYDRWQNEIPQDPLPTVDDCPPNVLNDFTRNYMLAEFWQSRAENLDREKRLKLP